MTPCIKIRILTNDQFVLDKVFYSNFYKIKITKDEALRPVVMDIGAHCGYFSFTAMALGAKKVFAFEPFLENYKLLLDNLADHRLKEVDVLTYQMGIYMNNTRLTFGYPSMRDGYFDFANIGEHHNVDNPQIAAAPSITLDNALENYVGEHVDVLKISIGYAETSILTSSKLIESQVSHICGESELDKASQDKFRAAMGQKGFIDCAFYPIPDDDDKVLFHFSRTNLSDVFEGP
jgi:FkbM family methyltransferase